MCSAKTLSHHGHGYPVTSPLRRMGYGAPGVGRQTGTLSATGHVFSFLVIALLTLDVGLASRPTEAPLTNTSGFNVTFSPDEIVIPLSTTVRVAYEIVYLSPDPPPTGLHVSAEISDETIAEIVGDVNHTIVNDTYSGDLDIRGLTFGRTFVKLRLTELGGGRNSSPAEVTSYDVVVRNESTTTTVVYLVVIGVMIVVYNFGFGCKIRGELIVEIVKKPVAPAIGFCCQFLVMSPLSFGIAQLLGLSDAAALGLLAIGSAPGGGGSNVFAYLLNADLELSITMSFISTVASLGMTPLWIWVFSRFYSVGDKIPIPVVNVFSSLAIVTIPVIVGLVVTKYKPKVAEKIAWCLKPASAVIGIVFLSLGIYVYKGALVQVSWRTLVACIVLAVLGYSIGALVGRVCRQSRRRWITISLETGFQNLALALMIIGTSMDPPESDLAGVVPVCYTFLSAAFPALAFIIVLIYKMCHGYKPWKSSGNADISSPDEPSAKGAAGEDVSGPDVPPSADKHVTQLSLPQISVSTVGVVPEVKVLPEAHGGSADANQNEKLRF